MNISPIKAAIAGRAQTNTNTLQLWNWNSVPILNPQPEIQQKNNNIKTRKKDLSWQCSTRYICTISRDDAPGCEGGVDAPHHPKHAEPAEMFSSLIHLQELGEVWVHYWDGAPDPARQHKAAVILQCNNSYTCKHSLPFLVDQTSINGHGCILRRPLMPLYVALRVLQLENTTRGS